VGEFASNSKPKLPLRRANATTVPASRHDRAIPLDSHSDLALAHSNPGWSGTGRKRLGKHKGENGMESTQEDFATRWALEDIEVLAQKGGLSTSDVFALLRIMSIHEILDYLDAKISNRLQ
jgi:hypothetical protein